MGLRKWSSPAPSPAPAPANLNTDAYAQEKAELLEEIETLKGELTKAQGEVARLTDLIESKPTSSWFDRFFGDGEQDDPIEQGFKIPLNKVYEAIESEIEHMIRIGYGPKTVGEYLALIQFYWQKALSDWGCSKKPPLDELDQIRKIGALAARCLQAYGAPPRVKSKAHPIPNQPDKHAPR